MTEEVEDLKEYALCLVLQGVEASSLSANDTVTIRLLVKGESRSHPQAKLRSKHISGRL